MEHMIKGINFDKIDQQKKRRLQLADKHPEVIQKMNEVKYYLDSDLVTMEGVEIENGLWEDLSVRVVLTRASGRLYIEIDRWFDGQEQDPAFKDETKVKERDFAKVPITVVDT